MTTVINSWNSVDGGTVTAIAQPTIEEPLKVHVNAEQYMLHKYGAFRGHFAWREIQSAYAQGQLDAAIAQPEQQIVSDSDFIESVGLMLSAVGYTEEYARQWPKEKVSVTFKRWFDAQIAAAKVISQPEQQTEPVAWMTVGYMGEPVIQRHPPQYANQVTPLYDHTAPVRQLLTEEQATNFYWESPQFDTYKDAFIGGIRAIEAKITGGRA